MLPDSGLKDCISSPLPHLCFVPPSITSRGLQGTSLSGNTLVGRVATAPRGRAMTRLRELSRGAGLAEDRGGCPAVARRRVAPGRKEVAMQMLRPMGWRGGGDAPLPRGPLVAKTDHSPRTVAWKRRCHSSLSVTVSQPAARRCWVKMCRTQHFCLPSHQSPPHERAWRLSLHQRARRNNWIGCLQKPISCSSLGTGGWGRLQTVFVTGLGPSHPADRP